MTYFSRNKRIALVAYAGLAVLIVGAAAWGTYAALELDARNRRDQTNASVRAALARIDWHLMPTIAREAGRQYWEYSPCIPVNDSDDENNTLAHGGGDLPNWIRLHFQVSPGNHWQSPQVSDDWCPLPPPPANAFSVTRRRELLQSLRGECMSYDVLANKIQTAEELNRRYECLAAGLPLDAIEGTSQHASEEPDDVCLHAGGNWTRAHAALVPGESCDPADVALQNLGQQVGGISDTGRVGVTPSIMTPIWFDCVDHQAHRLAFVRTADVEGTLFFQGFLVDWQLLRDELLAIIAEVLPEAELVPVESADATEVDRPIVLPNVALRTVAPARASSTYLTVGVAWLAVVAIMGGVGIGIRNVIVLAERRTQFAYAVTHELRTPLTTLRLYTDMLTSGLVALSDQPSYLETLHREAERLSTMVNGVLEYARVENRAVRLDVKSLSVDDLLESVRAHCVSSCEHAGKNLRVDVNGLSGSTITTDPQLMRQILSNLIDNACKHTRDAEDPSIVMRAESAHGNRLAIDIADHGPGISPADRQVIFKPFRRGGHGKTEASGGLGLGLALARSWSQLLGGHLEVVGNDGETGTCFRLTVPRSIAQVSTS